VHATLAPARGGPDAGLPIGIAHGARLLRPVRRGERVRRADVALDEAGDAARARRALEAAFPPAG